MIQYFKDCETNEEAKELYRKLSKQFHPDKPGGDEEKFKELGSQYAEFLKKENSSITIEQIIKAIINGVDNREFDAYLEMLIKMYPNSKKLNTAVGVIGIAKIMNKIIVKK